MFSNEEGMICNLEYLPGLARSDHVFLRFTVVCFVNAYASHSPRLTQTNFDHLNGFLRACNWEKISSMDIEEAYSLFKSHITKGLEECSTEKRVHVIKNIYMNHAAMQLRKRKQVL